MIEIGGTPIINTGGYGGFNGFDSGMGGGNFIWAFLLFALLSGGNGFNNNNGTNAIYSSQQFGQLDSGIRGVQNGMCDSTFALNNSIKDGTYNTAMSIQGVNTNLGNAICSQTYELSSEIKDLGAKMDLCCCQTQRSIDSINYNNERNTNAIIQANDRNTQKIYDYLVSEKMKEKDQRIFEMSQDAQTNKIINAQKPLAPIPAYLQPSPYGVYNVCTQPTAYPNVGF